MRKGRCILIGCLQGQNRFLQNWLPSVSGTIPYSIREVFLFSLIFPEKQINTTPDYAVGNK